LLKHGKKLTFLDILGEDGLSDDEENEANEFAKDFLLPVEKFNSFTKSRDFSAASIISFAKSQGISPGIVVGRLQYEGMLPWTHLNYLKVKYTWSHDN